MASRGDGGNGWRTGRDPVLRWLRAATVVAFVAVFVIVSLDRERDGTSVLTVLSLAGGGALILLGYQGLTRLPMIGDRKDDRDRGEGE